MTPRIMQALPEESESTPWGYTHIYDLDKLKRAGKASTELGHLMERYSDVVRGKI